MASQDNSCVSRFCSLLFFCCAVPLPERKPVPEYRRNASARSSAGSSPPNFQQSNPYASSNFRTKSSKTSKQTAFDLETLWESKKRPKDFYEMASEMYRLVQGENLTPKDKDFCFKILGKERKERVGNPRQNLYLYLRKKLNIPIVDTQIDSDEKKTKNKKLREQVDNLRDLLKKLEMPENRKEAMILGKKYPLRVRF